MSTSEQLKARLISNLIGARGNKSDAEQFRIFAEGKIYTYSHDVGKHKIKCITLGDARKFIERNIQDDSNDLIKSIFDSRLVFNNGKRKEKSIRVYNHKIKTTPKRDLELISIDELNKFFDSDSVLSTDVSLLFLK